ncbi:NAD(P)-binding domain-containing protein [Paenibacillus sp. sptzw28]|uniref:NAD(P)-binding domain-containing protein n=1 Tax=Paenibacillus sp. sptzw28 TaxID=715179 RepID=UPI0021613217|nr:NAD(P)-binding domain-containing protein [Paenibacillus sp. sptzw28]
MVEASQRKKVEPTPVTILGLGPMGRALAGTFLSNGHPTTVWNRSTGKADELLRRGATLANTAADAAVASPLIVVCVLNYHAVHSILGQIGVAIQGRTLGTSPEVRRKVQEK